MNAKTDLCRRCGEGFPAALDPGDYEGICPACLAGIATEADVVPSFVDPLAQAAKDPPPLKRGATFRGLEVLELVGQGGMGVVYKARQIELGRIVALKILSPRLAADPEFTRRFTREAQALASLDHPNVVRVHDVGREGDLCFLVMEFVDGATLRELLVQRRLAPDQALRLVPQLCAALEYAHSRGVIHRDVKPENILVSTSGAAKIADFGLAKIVSADALAASALTQTNIVMGTVNYMAPEQREGNREADHRADIYSLGVVFYELLTGELPVGRFEPPSRRKSVDARLDEVVLRALEKDPDRRYQKAGELGRDVERLAGGADAPPADCPILDMVGNRRLGLAPGRRLVLRTVACPVTVRGWDRPEIGVSIDGDFQFDGEASVPVLQSQVDTRSVVVHAPSGVDLELAVDEGDARLYDVLGSVSARVADGRLDVAGHTGPLRAQVGQGSATVTGLRSEYVEIRSRSGEIVVHDFLLTAGRGQIESEAGPVDVEAAPGSSFRFHLESRIGTIDGPPSGQVGAGAGWLTVRASAGNIRFRGPSPLVMGWRDFLARLTSSDIEKIGVYAIVNAGLFLFFGLVAGTTLPAIMVAVFWGMGLVLQLWKGYIRGTPGRSLTESVPDMVRKAMALVPTPAPAPPKPPDPPPAPAPPAAKTSALAVLALLFALPAALCALGACVTLLVERSPVFQLSSYDLDTARLAAIAMGSVAFVAGTFAFVLGLTASAHLAEAGGALRGRGLGQAALILSFASLLLVGLWARPRLLDVGRASLGVRQATQAYLSRLQGRRAAEAAAHLESGLRGRRTSEELEALAEKFRSRTRGGPFTVQGRVQVSADRMTARLYAFIECPKAPTTHANFDLSRHEGAWRIVNDDDFKRTLGE